MKDWFHMKQCLLLSVVLIKIFLYFLIESAYKSGKPTTKYVRDDDVICC